MVHVIKCDRTADLLVDAVIEVLDTVLACLIVVLDDETGLGGVGKLLKIETEPAERRLLVTIGTADMDVDRRVP